MHRRYLCFSLPQISGHGTRPLERLSEGLAAYVTAHRSLGRLACSTLALILCLGIFAPACVAKDIVLKNTFGLDVIAVYAAVRGHEPVRIAGPLADGMQVTVDSEPLRACSRLLLHVDDTTDLQFFTSGYLDSAKELVLEVYSGEQGKLVPFPRLLVTMEDGQTVAYPAGLSWSLMQGAMEQGLTEKTYAEWMHPLGLKKADSTLFAVSLAEVSWSVDPEGTVYTNTVLNRLVLRSSFTGSVFEDILAELRAGGTEPLLLSFAPDKATAFAPEGMQLEEKAVLSKGLETADAQARWEALLEKIKAMDLADFQKEKPRLRLVVASPAVTYELVLHMDEAEAVLRLTRR